ncbi:MAG: ABC transporter ATP-binding protein/permease [Alphaproteobacteria bacterium]
MPGNVPLNPPSPPPLGGPAGTPPKRSHWATLRTLAPFLWPGPAVEGARGMRLRVMAALACLVAAKLLTVYTPILLAGAVDALTSMEETRAEDAAGLDAGTVAAAIPLALSIGYGLARLGSILFGELRGAIFARVTLRAMRTVALRTFGHLHALSLRFHLERRTGGLSRVIERGTNGIEFLLDFMLFNVLPTLLEIVLVCAILWALFDFWFAAVTFVSVSGYIAFTLVVTERRLKHRREMNDRDTEANTKAVDSLLNFETVKYFGAEAHEAARYDVAMRGYEEAAVRAKVSLAFLNVGQAAIIAGGLTLIMVMAANGAAAGTMTVGDFVMVNTYLLQLYMPLNFLGFVYREIKRSLVDMEDMFALLRTNAEVADRPGAVPLAVAGGAIAFDHVSFGYDPRRPILKDLSFAAAPGTMVAIVGASGAGKSTIGRLLFRFYDVDDGAIRVDGQDIRDVTQESLRAALGVVPQDTVMFNDTIHYNIQYGRPSASEAEIENAARMARIHEFITTLPDGYATTVGERGLKLSGGEKQRVAIARAILKDPPIMLFDEATSALDSTTEKAIQASLAAVAANRTTLVIAHRLSTVVNADEIIVMDDGQVVERGRHATLLARGGVYAAMWAKQQSGEDGAAPPARENAEEPADAV